MSVEEKPVKPRKRRAYRRSAGNGQLPVKPNFCWNCGAPQHLTATVRR